MDHDGLQNVNRNFDQLRRLAEQALTGRPLDGEKLVAGDVDRLFHELQVHQIELEMQNEELRRVQRELETARDKYTRLYDFAPVGYFTLDKNGLIQDANITGAAMLDVERRTLLGHPFAHLVVREDRDIYHLHHKKATATGKRERCEIRLLREDVPFFARLDSVSCQGAEDVGVCLKMVVSDITERKQMAEHIRLSEERFQLMFHSSPIGIAIGTPEGRMTETNRALQEMLGYRGEALQGMRIVELTHPADRKRTIQLVNELFTGQRPSYQIEERLLRKDGAMVWAWTTAGSVCGPEPNGKPTYIFAMIQDITQQKQSLEALARVKEQIEFRERARLADVLHDVVLQNLQVALLSLKNIRQVCHPCQTLPLDLMNPTIDGITEAINLLRDVSAEFHPAFLDRMELGQAIRWKCEQFGRLCGIRTRFIDNDHLEGMTPYFKRNFFLIFQEAMTNAIKHAGIREMDVLLEREGSQGLLLKISDQGRGFDPTKIEENAKGLGLAIIKERTMRIKGDLKIESTPGRGTTIQLRASLQP